MSLPACPQKKYAAYVFCQNREMSLGKTNANVMDYGPNVKHVEMLRDELLIQMKYAHITETIKDGISTNGAAIIKFIMRHIVKKFVKKEGLAMQRILRKPLKSYGGDGHRRNKPARMI